MGSNRNLTRTSKVNSGSYVEYFFETEQTKNTCARISIKESEIGRHRVARTWADCVTENTATAVPGGDASSDGQRERSGFLSRNKKPWKPQTVLAEPFG